jgi:Uma2 family endonuclease
VADSSLRLDREGKLALYARARIAEYWIVNLVDRVLEVHRAPTGPVEAPGEPHYGVSVFLGREGTVRPLAASAAAIAVTDLLP